MARRKRHRRRRVSGTTYAAVGKSRRKRRRINGSTYAAVGKHKRRRRRMGDSSSMMNDTKNYAMILLGGGIAKIGADILNPMAYGMARGPLVPGIIKGAIGAYLFHKGKRSSPLVEGAGIGLGVSGLEDVARAMQFPWVPFLPLKADNTGKYSYAQVGAPAKDLFVVLPEHKQVSGERDAPVIAGDEMGADAPVISADAPVISGSDYSGVIGGF